MSTHTPGSPEWLRLFASALARLHWQETSPDLSGLRAAAERIEELERVQAALKKEVAAANKGARTNALVNESLLALEKNYIRKCAEVSDEVQRLCAENEALKQESRERLRMAGDLYLALIRLDALYRDEHSYPSPGERDWLVGPITRFEQARKEGA